MKKTVLFLGTLLMVVTLLLTGCGGSKQAGAGAQDVVNKAAAATADNKTSAPLSTADKSQDSKNQAVSSQTVENTPQAEAAKTTDNAKPAENKTAETTPATNQSSGTADQDKGNASVAAASSSVSPASAPTAKKTVTMAINCQMAVNKGLAQQEKFKGVVPADGVILAPVTVELKDNQSAFDILRSVVRDKKIHMDYEGSKGTPYVKGINNLYEFDGGPLSGWMFCVNKAYPNYGSAEYKLKPGDAIEWNYTCDLGKDLGQDWVKNSK